MKDKVFLTGASGFVGRHVLRELQRRGVETWTLGISQISSSRHWKGRIEELPESLQSALSQEKTIKVLHLAWGGLGNFDNPEHLSQELPKHVGFFSILEQLDIKDWLVVGTCLEYGLLEGEMSEEFEQRPILPYAIAKTALRHFLTSRAKRHGGKLTWARLFYTYGEGQNPKSLYPLLELAIAQGDTEFAMSAGDQVRDYLSIEELAALIVDLRLAGGDFGVTNVCSGHGLSVLKFVNDFLSKRGKKIVLKTGVYGYPWYEPKAFWGSRKKLDSILGNNNGSNSGI